MYVAADESGTYKHTHTHTQGLSHVLCRSRFNGEKSSGRWVRKSPAHRLWYVLLSIRSRMSWAESGLNIAASSRLPTTLTCKRVGGVEALGASSGPVCLYSTRLKKCHVFLILYCTVKRRSRSNMSVPQIPTPSPAVGALSTSC